MTMQYQANLTRVNGADISYLDEGKGDPVVFVHGYFGDFRSWRFQMGPFSKHHRTIAYSLRYNYPATTSTENSDLAETTHARDLAGIIQKLALQPANVVSSSYGGVVALLLARDHPELVRTLVLGEPGLLSWLQELPGGTPLLSDFQTKVADPAKKAAQEGDMEKAMRLVIDGLAGYGTYDKIPEDARREITSNAHLAMSYNFSDAFRPEDAKTIRLPTLLLTGDISPKMFLMIANELARLMPNLERGQIPAASHMLQSFNPSVYNETVLKFLEKQRL